MEYVFVCRVSSRFDLGGYAGMPIALPTLPGTRHFASGCGRTDDGRNYSGFG